MAVEIRDGEPTPDAVRRQLRRMLASTVFANAPRLSAFLQFGVEAALAGAKSVNEYSIGVDVFERDSSFDPRLDPIVRVHARRLRAKLSQYYDSDGLEDRIEIQLPLRCYIPVFRERVPRGLPPPLLRKFQSESGGPASIGVYRFTNLTPERRSDYFAEGLTREVIHSLAKGTDWRVVSCTDYERRPDGHDRGFDVQMALSGTLRKAEKRLRVSAELLSIPDGTVLWSDMYEVEIEDVISTQEKIACAICEALIRQLAAWRGK